MKVSLKHLCVHSSPPIPQSLCPVRLNPPVVAQHLFFPPSMEPEEGKQSSHKTPYTELEQVNSDFILAITLQEQERSFSMLATIDSESDHEEVSESSFENDDDDFDEDAAFFENQEFELADLEFHEAEGSNDEEMEEDEIDPDELSYEELIELGEFIGEERRGLSATEIPLCLHPHTCHFADNKSGTDRCVICQVEYEEGDALVALPCEHPYHTDCITKWLQMKKVCPICTNEVSTPKLPNKP